MGGTSRCKVPQNFSHMQEGMLKSLYDFSHMPAPGKKTTWEKERKNGDIIRCPLFSLYGYGITGLLTGQGTG
ncbi:MAG: hypothetical protein ACPLRA_06525, partial [Candidatus Saccharicenans sp.]